LHARLANLFGVDLVGLWIGEDVIVDSSNNVTSWPGRVGGTLANAGVGRYNPTTISGRKAVLVANPSSTTTALFVNTGVQLKTTIMVAVTPSIPFAFVETGFEIAISGTSGVNNLTTVQGANLLYSAGGQVHYVDGILTHACSSGVHNFEGSLAASITTGVKVGQAGGNYTWRSPIGCGMALSAEPASGNRAESLRILREYYGLR
jgi:hypothetical protein